MPFIDFRPHINVDATKLTLNGVETLKKGRQLLMRWGFMQHGTKTQQKLDRTLIFKNKTIYSGFHILYNNNMTSHVKFENVG